jgi:hypothetical protein
VFLCASAPQLAHADIGDWLDKLEKLSGPGHFRGRSFFVDLFCYESHSNNPPVPPVTLNTELWTKIPKNINGADPQHQRDLPAEPTNQDAKDEKAIRDFIRKVAAWQKREGDLLSDKPEHAFVEFCTGDLRNPTVRFGGGVAFLRTDELGDYRYSEAQEKLSKEINAYPVAATVSTTVWFKNARPPERLVRSFEVGAAVGKIRFTGCRFPTFSLWFAEFPRVIFRPLAFFFACRNQPHCPAQWRGWDLLEFEGAGRWIQSVDSAKFGAEPGTSSGSHFQWKARVGFTVKLNWWQLPPDDSQPVAVAAIPVSSRASGTSPRVQ